jgi:TRAP-type C4-dicarboxylate transport system substrate-binding protein
MAIPFLFQSYEEVDFVKEGLLPALEERFREKGLDLVALTEVGFIYAMSTKPINTLDDLQKSKNWGPAGDPISETYLPALGITPVQLAIPDVLSSLQSGLIETVYNSLYGSIVMQWFTKARYVVDAPYGYAYGVFALDGKKFTSLPIAHQQAIDTAADRHFPVLLQETRKSNLESRRVMLERGTEFLKVDGETLRVLQEKRDVAVKELIPDSLSREIYQQTTDLLGEFRGKIAGGQAN